MYRRHGIRWIWLGMAIVWSLGHTPVYAQGPPIHTDTPITLGLEGRGVRTFVGVMRKGRLLQDGNEIPDPLNRAATAVVTPLMIPYNVTSNTVGGVVVPLVAKRLTNSAGTTSASGVGDLGVFLKQVALQWDRKQETVRTLLKGALTLPTGDENATPALGAGAVDWGVGQVTAWIKNRTGVYLETVYTLAGKANQVERGDRFAFNTALGYRLAPGVYRTYPARQLNAYVELNGVWEGRSGRPSQAVYANSGGTTLFVSPGLQYIPSRRFMVEASWQFPILEELHGVQLGTTYVFDLGVRVLVF